MSKQANPTLIGAFVVGALVLGVGAVMILGGGELFRERDRYVLFFEGSVKGLNVGAPVTFRGVRIGTVTDVSIEVDPKRQQFLIPVFIETEPGRIKVLDLETMGPEELARLGSELSMEELVNAGLRGQLQLQSLLTGQLFIQIDFHPDTPIRRVSYLKDVDEIPTIPTPMQELAKILDKYPIDKLIQDISNAADGIAKFVNSPELSQSVTSFRQTMDDFGKLARNVDREIGPLADNANEAFSDAQDALVEARKAMIQARSTLESVDGVVADDSPVMYELANALKELGDAARSVRVLADSLDRQPESVIQGRRTTGGRQ